MIVHDEHLPRGLWKLGRVQELFEGRDGHCRGAIVKTVTRDRQQVLLRRPITLLYPLELKNPDEDKVSVNEPSETEIVSTSSTKEPPAVDDSETQRDADAPTETRRRSSCVAARLGDEQRKACMFELED